MNLTLNISIVLWFIAIAWSITLILKNKDWRIIIVTITYCLLALDQLFDIWTIESNLFNASSRQFMELPDLITSVMAFVALIFLQQIINNNKRKQDEQELIQNQLKESEEKYRALFETSLVGMAMNKQDGTLVEVNQAYLDIIGYSKEEALKLSYWDLTPESYEEEEYEQIKSLKETGSYGPYEKEYIHKEGHNVPVLLNGVTVKSVDGQECTWSCIHNITDRKQIETALADSEERFSLAMQGANDGLWDWDIESNEVYYSPRWKSMLGYSEEEVQHKFSEWERLVDPDDKNRVQSEIDAYLKGKTEKYETEFKMLHKDGQYRDILSRAFAVKDKAGKPARLVGTHVDITSRKRTEAMLQEAMDFLETAVEQSPAGIIIADAPNVNIRLANRAAFNIRGMDSSLLTNINVSEHASKWKTTRLDGTEYIPEDLPLSRAILRGEIVEDEELYIQHESGENHIVSANAAPIFNQSGDVIAGIVVFQDITEQKKLELELSTINKAIENSLNAFDIIDENGKFVYVNKAYVDMWGYDSAEEILGTSPVSHCVDSETPSYVIKLLKSNGSCTIEIKAKRKDGSEFDALMYARLDHDYQGNEIYPTTSIDITDRKEFVTALEESELKFRNLVEGSLQGIFVHKDFKPLFANKKCAEMFGYSNPEEILKLDSMLHFWAPDERDRIKDFRTRRMEGKSVPANYECQGMRKDGTLFWFENHVTTINWHGEIAIQAAVIDITDRKLADQQLSYYASHDTLTGLVNRREFEHRAKLLLSNIQRSKKEHALCFMDLDQFKVVNDTCGHTSGDEMLRQLSSLLKDAVRESDTLARLGGDEFGVLMEHCSVEEAQRVATVLLKTIHDYQFSWQEHCFNVGVSIGLVPISSDSTDITELLKQADAACYMAKDKGRNRIHVYNAEDTELAQRHGEMQWVARINQAIQHNRFCLFSQTIEPLDYSDDEHYELLVRMIDEKGEIIPPGSFLPAAERYNLIEQLDSWVINEAFSLLASNPNFLNRINFISINLSGQSLTKDHFLKLIIDKLKQFDIKGEKICFEITETAAISNLTTAIKFISSLKKMNCRFALDDFGSGLSSFGYLKNLPVDYLKIDGMFVKDIVDDPIDRAMVKSINEIGQVMGMQTIAEFVENDMIKGMLKEIGVNYVQGYGIGKPVDLKELLG
ncbi:MAG: PAS domain S-box protein [Proteobacteria bacterium]|nr:PAS domain S-box protein [Pseudomonadota bacterium]NOG58967.1 PAS domain S-box protein [Pseudomonadota bacterium]